MECWKPGRVMFHHSPSHTHVLVSPLVSQEMMFWSGEGSPVSKVPFSPVFTLFVLCMQCGGRQNAMHGTAQMWIFCSLCSTHTDNPGPVPPIGVTRGRRGPASLGWKYVPEFPIEKYQQHLLTLSLHWPLWPILMKTYTITCVHTPLVAHST